MNIQFTLDEINNLLTALKVWESEPVSSGFSSSLLGIILSGIGEQDKDKQKQERADAARKSEQERLRATREADVRHEQSILLQAKLIQMRNEILRDHVREGESM